MEFRQKLGVMGEYLTGLGVAAVGIAGMSELYDRGNEEGMLYVGFVATCGATLLVLDSVNRGRDAEAQASIEQQNDY